MKEWLAYALVWFVLKTVGAMPRPLARATLAPVARASGRGIAPTVFSTNHTKA